MRKRRSDRTRRWIQAGLTMTLLAVSTSAWAGGQSSKAEPEANANASSTATAISGASAIANGGSSNVSVIVAPSQKNEQTSIQGQNQSQANKQSQQNSQTATQSYEGYQGYTGNQNTSVNVETPRQAPAALPAALSVSSLTCYGSWSIAASTPFGGVGAGFPTRDDGCSRVRNALALQALGQPAAALRVLATDPDVKQALAESGVTFAAATPKPTVQAVTVQPAALFQGGN